MAYDPIRRVVVRFGGNRGKPKGETHVWDGKTWTLASTGGPPAREHGEMAWDSLRERMVLFGGLNGGRLGDTWEWDGKTWTQRKPKTLPGSDYGHSLAYHAGIGRVVMYGGNDNPGETWSWDGNDWTKHSTKWGGVGKLSWPAMAYDAKRNQIVVLGDAVVPATSPTYLYIAPTKAPAVTKIFGKGCAGNAGTPALQFILPPYISAPSSLEMTSIPTSGFAIPFLYIGGSNTIWAGNKLPLDLVIAGAPGCNLNVRPDLLIALANAGGKASFQATIPFDVSLVGKTIYGQGFVADGTANALGVAVSNGVEGKVGQRW